MMKGILWIIQLILSLIICESVLIFNKRFINNVDDWTWSGTGDLAIPVNWPECQQMGTNRCLWLKEDIQLYHFESTLGFNNIQLRYSAISSELEADDECRIYYSIDSSMNWGTPIVTINTTSYNGYHTVPLPLASNNSGVGINLASASNENVDNCFFFNISLFGDRLPTTNPTSTPTAAPSTSTPTTSNPTTSIPTTSIPTTSIPTTSNPSTSMPTTSKPTTSIPTTSNPTTSKPTTSKPTTSIPTTSIPTTSNPTTSMPTTSKPTTSNPSTSMPTTPNPTTSIPTTSNPTTSTPTTSDPDTSHPTILNALIISTTLNSIRTNPTYSSDIDLRITISSNKTINKTKVEQIVSNTLNIYLSDISYDLSTDIITTDQTNIITLILRIDDDENVDINNDKMEEKIQEDLDNQSDGTIFTVNIEEITTSSMDDTQNISDHYDLIMLIVALLLMVIIIVSYIYSNFIFVNDFFRVGALMTASLHILDTISDIVFSVNISNDIILGLSIAFIISAVLLTLYQLFHNINKWKRNDVLSQWISDNIQFLYIISALTGSAFAGVAVCTSNAFGMVQTDMPLTKTQLLQFQTKRMYSTVLVENIPQLGLQVWCLISYGGGSHIIYISMAFSVLSIVVSVLSMVSQRNILRSRDYVSVEIDVTGPVVVGNINKCRDRVKKLQIQMAALLGLNRSLIEITRPKAIKKGLNIHVNIFVNNAMAIDMNIEREINNAVQVGELGEIMKVSWDLPSMPLIGNIKYEKYESKQRRDNKVVIKAPSQQATNKEIMMSRVISSSDMSNEQRNKENAENAENAENEGQLLPAKIPPVVTTPGLFNSYNDEDSDDERSKDKTLGTITGGNNNNMDIEHDEVVMGDDEITKGMTNDNEYGNNEGGGNTFG